MHIIHIKQTPLAWAPDEVVDVLKRYGKHNYYLCNQHNYKNLIDTLPSDECIIHLHNKYLKIDNVKSERQLIQFHSEPFNCDINCLLQTKLVLNQYHSTLQVYKDACNFTVKNTCDPYNYMPNFSQPIFCKDKIKIVYIPSTTKRHNTYADKGFEETVTILKKIFEKYSNIVNIIIKTGITYCESIMEKIDAHIVIDECKTGSFHKTSIEGLTFGSIVFANISEELQKELLKKEKVLIPIENVKIDELEASLEEWILKGKDKIEEVAIDRFKIFNDNYGAKKVAEEFDNIYDYLNSEQHNKLVNIKKPIMKIGFFSSFNYHLECCGFILDFLSKLNCSPPLVVLFFVESDNFGYLQFYKKRFENLNIKIYNYKELLSDNLDVIFKLSSNDDKLSNLVGDSQLDKIISITHTYNLKDNVKRKIYFSPYLPMKDNPDAYLTLPVYDIFLNPSRGLETEIALRAKQPLNIIWVGQMKEHWCDTDLINFIKGMPDCVFVFISYSGIFEAYHKLSVFSNCVFKFDKDFQEIIDFVKEHKDNSLMMIRKFPYQYKDRYSGSYSLGLSLNIPFIIQKEIADDYNLNGIIFEKDYCEIVDKIKCMTNFDLQTHISKSYKIKEKYSNINSEQLKAVLGNNVIAKFTQDSNISIAKNINISYSELAIKYNQSKKQIINLIYYKDSRGYGNFGDEISKYLVENLINKEKYKLITNSKSNDSINMIAIGSYIQCAPNNCVIYGSGVRTNPPVEYGHTYTNLNVKAIRGPLTKKFLNDKNIFVPDIYGDPALLLSLFYKPNYIPELQDKIGLVPHISNYELYLKKTIPKNFILICPFDKWENVIDQIYSCKYIVSSALHGLICSDAYNKPNVWLNEFKLNEGEFKFKDYFLSQNRNSINISNIDEFDETKLYTQGNTINLEKLKNAFDYI